MFNLRPRLNEDVLNQIYEHCPNSTLTVLCRVSSDTRELARRHMCRTVSLERNPGQLCAFLKYIVDNTHCAETGKIWGAGSHVLQLNLHWKSVSADWHNSVAGHSDFAVEDPRYPMSRWAPTLAHALTLMPRLRVFFLEAMAEKIAYHSPQFGVALGNHPSLSSIDLWFVGPLLSDQLARAAESRSFGKLQEVKLYIINGRRESEAVGRFLLRNRDHLTKISTSSWDFGVLNRIANSNSKRIAPAIFPNVVDLTVVNLHRFSFIEDIATFFPAMRTLAINWTKGDNLIVAPPSNNICFPNLVSIEGEWETISILLDCNINNAHIRRLIMSLYAEWESGTQIDDSDPKTFRGAAATSSLKSLRFMQYQIRSASWWTTFGRTIPCLTILEMGLGMKVTDMHLLCNEIPCILASAPLVCISLWLNEPRENGREERQQRLHSNHDIALSFAKHIPTLRCIDVQIHESWDDQQDVHGWWIVAHDEPSPYLKAVQASEGETTKKVYEDEVFNKE